MAIIPGSRRFARQSLRVARGLDQHALDRDCRVRYSEGARDHLRSALLILGRHLGIPRVRLLRSLRSATPHHVAFWIRTLADRINITTAPPEIQRVLRGEVA